MTTEHLLNTSTRRFCREHSVEEITVTALSQINLGDHVSVCGSYSQKNKYRYCKCLYRHHFIVSKINPISETVGEIRSIGFERNDNDSKRDLRVKEIEWEIDLKICVYKVIKYLDPTPLNGQERVNYARELMAKHPPYSLTGFNCEHFCNMVCTKAKYSSQTKLYEKYLIELCLICISLLAATLLGDKFPSSYRDAFEIVQNSSIIYSLREMGMVRVIKCQRSESLECVEKDVLCLVNFLIIICFLGLLKLAVLTGYTFCFFCLAFSCGVLFKLLVFLKYNFIF